MESEYRVQNEQTFTQDPVRVHEHQNNSEISYSNE